MTATVEITGIEQVKKILSDVTPRHANNLMRNTIRAIAAGIRKDIMANAPKRTGEMVKAKNIKVKMRRAIKGAQIAEVVFADKSYYWRFVEHGTSGKNSISAQPFVIPARDRAAAGMDRVIVDSFSKSLEKAIKRELKKQAKASQ